MVSRSFQHDQCIDQCENATAENLPSRQGFLDCWADEILANLVDETIETLYS